MGDSAYRPDGLRHFWERVTEDPALQGKIQRLPRGFPAPQSLALRTRSLATGNAPRRPARGNALRNSRDAADAKITEAPPGSAVRLSPAPLGSSSRTVNIIAVDWGKDARKRSAYRADLAARRITRIGFDGSVAQLVESAAAWDPPVLIGIDAAIGFPRPAWDGLLADVTGPAPNFIDHLLHAALPARFFDPVANPSEWSPKRPFIRPAAGRWSLTRFIEVSGDGLHRKIDRLLSANPVFVTSGLPGSVGSGTRALWRELIALAAGPALKVWPFHGTMAHLLATGGLAIAEIYPKACYGIALAETLPAPLLALAKTQQGTRYHAVHGLLESDWVAAADVSILDSETAIANEDDFDALISAAALLRLVLAKAPLGSLGPEDPVAEGGVLGSASVLPTSRRSPGGMHAVPGPARLRAAPVAKAYPCPIPGCSHVFRNGRGGWDAHVAALQRHPDWRPEVTDPVRRKQLFRREFAAWFRN